MKIDLSDLSDLCKGDTVFSINYGHIRVLSITNEIINTDDDSYYIDGKFSKEDMHPSLFHSIEECIEYFQSVKKEMDEAVRLKRRYWIWDIKSSTGWYKNTSYMDDNGYCTDGSVLIPDWNDKQKFKHENEFIDV